jgi:hypothetical protein
LFLLTLPCVAQLVPPVSALKQHAPATTVAATQPPNPPVSYRFDDLVITNYGAAGATFDGGSSVPGGSAAVASGTIVQTADPGDSYWFPSGDFGLTGTSNWSFAGWFEKPDGTSDYTLVGDIANKPAACCTFAEAGSFTIYFSSTNITCALLDSSSARADVIGTNAVGMNHWAFTYDETSGELSIYRNGVLNSSNTEMSGRDAGAGAGDMRLIGGYNDESVPAEVSIFAGTAAAMQVWTGHKLTPAEVTFLYNGGNQLEYFSGSWATP